MQKISEQPFCRTPLGECIWQVLCIVKGSFPNFASNIKRISANWLTSLGFVMMSGGIEVINLLKLIIFGSEIWQQFEAIMIIQSTNSNY